MALTRIKGSSQLQPASVTNAQIAAPDGSNPNGILLSKIQDGAKLVKNDGTVAFTTTISGVTPTQPAHLATKGYVDSTAQGLDVKASVRVIATTNVTRSGTQTIDGVSLSVGDRVLLAGQTAGSENGIYTVAAGAWARATDADTAGEVTSGLFTFVEEGTVNKGTGWTLTTANPITLDTTALTFVQFSSAGTILGGAGLTKTGNTIDVVSANGGIVVNPDNIALTLDGSTLAITASGLKLADLPSGNLLIGSGANIATARAISGVLTISATGVTALNDASVGLAKLASGTAGQVILANSSGVPTYTTISGDATIDATGSLQLASNSVTSAELAANSVVTAKILNANVTLGKIETLPSSAFILGNGTANQAVVLSGDISVSNTGVVTITTNSLVRDEDLIVREQPAGDVNGVNDTFVLDFTPRLDSESVFVNGILQDPGVGNDYTIAGPTITMLYPLTEDDKLRVTYLK